MKKVLLDTNVILDFALQREKYVANSRKILQLAFESKIVAFITATTITDIYYIARKNIGKKKSLDFLVNILSFLEVANVDKRVILRALELDFNDFEDAIQECSAYHSDIPIIITRNEKDYKDSRLHIFNPEEYLKHLSGN